MVGAIALTKFNEISSEIVNFRNKSFDVNYIDKAQAFAFIDELKPLTKTNDKALAFSLLGTLYCLLGDLNNMEFNYRTALKFSPGDIRIRFNYAIDLYYSHCPASALTQAREILNLNVKDIGMLYSIYLLLDSLIKINECKKVMQMIEKLPAKQTKDYFTWINNKKSLLKAYHDLKIDLPLLSKLIDGIQSDLSPQHPKSVYVEHYYDYDDKTIVYSFIDEKSDVDSAFKFDEQLTDYIIEFERKNNVHFHNFVMMYEAR
nr:MAG TPA: Type 4 fimbrial biogenesis protein, Type IV pilus biogenesis.0A [Bacteriophage sp.]